MDKGLDINLKRTLIAFHAATYLRPADLRAATAICHSHPRPESALLALASTRGIALDWHAADRAFDWQAAERCHIATLCDDSFPNLLKTIHDPPLEQI